MKLTTSLLVFFAATALAGVAEPRAELDDLEAFNVTDVEDPAESFNLEYASLTTPSLARCIFQVIIMLTSTKEAPQLQRPPQELRGVHGQPHRPDELAPQLVCSLAGRRPCRFSLIGFTGE